MNHSRAVLMDIDGTFSRVVTFDGKHERAAALALTALRVGVGAILAVHGWAKLSDIAGTSESFAQLAMPAPQVLVYLAIAGEFLGGLGLLVGLLTRVAALGPLCSMLVAILTVHIGHGLLAKNGGFEYPLVLLLVSSFFALNGAGPWSLDALIAKRAERRPLLGWNGSVRVRDQIPSRP
ncbi:MAG TPA: DoxX family protein [Polyangiaceae bacterium]